MSILRKQFELETGGEYETSATGIYLYEYSKWLESQIARLSQKCEAENKSAWDNFERCELHRKNEARLKTTLDNILRPTW